MGNWVFFAVGFFFAVAMILFSSKLFVAIYNRCLPKMMSVTFARPQLSHAPLAVGGLALPLKDRLSPGPAVLSLIFTGASA